MLGHTPQAAMHKRGAAGEQAGAGVAATMMAMEAGVVATTTMVAEVATDPAAVVNGVRGMLPAYAGLDVP